MEQKSMYESEQPINIKCRCPESSCTKIGYQYADINIPIELKPTTTLEAIGIECCGEPEVKCKKSKCSDTCEVTLTQKVSIKLKINYQVSACTGDSTIECCDTPCCR